MTDPVVTFDEPYADDLPAGWFANNKPATMEDLWNDPFYIKSIFMLTENQKWALVIARIKKRPNFYLDLDYNVFDQFGALQHLYLKDSIGEDIRANELDWLYELREDRMNELAVLF
jgi:hypothetical protein